MTDFQLDCLDFDGALDFYTGEAGFRLDLIYPADNPRIAELSGYGISLRLESTNAVIAASGNPLEIIIQTTDDDSWGSGRAGMQYREGR